MPLIHFSPPPYSRSFSIKAHHRLFFLFISCLVYVFMGSGNIETSLAQTDSGVPKDVQTRTIIAELLEIEGEYYIARGERGEIRIQVDDQSNIAEEFTFGDRIKAVVLPNDVALSIVRAQPDEPFGIVENSPSPTAPSSQPAQETASPGSESPAEESGAEPLAMAKKIRVITADLLMVDGSFYIVRSEHGEIQIEITPETELSEEFKFGDRIKARVTPQDKALSVVRAGKNDPTGITIEGLAAQKTPATAPSKSSSSNPSPSSQHKGGEPGPSADVGEKVRTIIANVLMVDGDFIIVRGERGEIQIEVTPKTEISESFDYGDKIKATVLPNDKALTVERAKPEDPIGIQ